MSSIYLEDKRRKESAKKKELDSQIFHEARLLQVRAEESVSEANVYAEILAKSCRYAVLSREAREDAFWTYVQVNQHDGDLSRSDLPIGTGKRIEKMLVKSWELGNESNFRLLSMDNFLREHSRLLYELKKSRLWLNPW